MTTPLPSLTLSATPSVGALEDRIAHLHWRKVCNEREIQGSIRKTKQLQERDEFLRIAKNDKKDKQQWMHAVIQDELQRPLPVSQQFLDELAQQDAELVKSRECATQRHLTHIKHIQAKLDDREVQLTRKKAYELKKKQLFGDNAP